MTPEITLILIILAVSALMLPVVMGLTQHTNTPPSRRFAPDAAGLGQNADASKAQAQCCASPIRTAGTGFFKSLTRSVR